MGSTRRNFTEEYKEEAFRFVIEGDRSIAEVARNIGVHEMTLGKWVKKARDAQAAATPHPLAGQPVAHGSQPSRKLIGWAIADHMRTSLVTDALGCGSSWSTATG